MMKEDGRKKIYLFCLLGLCLIPLIMVALLVGIVDPFFVYHKPLEGTYYIIDNQLEQNPGIAKHFEYDSVILGSSMTTNFDTNLFDEVLGSKTVKLSYNAAYPKNIDAIMQIVEREKELTNAYLCIDILNYMHQPGAVAFPIPEHLYDKNPFNDLKYLLNKEVVISYIVQAYLKKTSTPINEIYWHWQYMTYDREHVLSNYVKPEWKEKVNAKESKGLENLEQNLQLFIEPYIQDMEDTQFHVFFPPYSMLYWYDAMANGDAELRIEGMRQVTKKLLTYPNVKVHYFQNQFEWISNLDNYTDPTHYSKEITDLITYSLCDDSKMVTEENYDELLDEMKEFILNYDYDSYFE